MSRLCNSSHRPKKEKRMEEDNTELSLKLRYEDETVSFINPDTQARRFSRRTLAGAAEHSAQDMVSTQGERREFNASSGSLISASCAFVKREILDMDAVSCRAPRDESDDMIIPGTPRKKLRLSKDQSSLLEESFREHSALSPKHKSALACKLNLQPRQVEVWFQNRRARTKLKRKEVECDNLKRCCESLREENRRLVREVQALRAMKIVRGTGKEDLYAQSPLAAATLTMCPSCERLATKTSTTTIASQTKTIPPRLISQFPCNQSAVC